MRPFHDDCVARRERHGLRLASAALLLLLAGAEALAADVAALVKQFETAKNGRSAAMKIFENYAEYKNLVKDGRVPAKVARAVDEHMINMTRETWSQVALGQGARGLDCVVPVGTVGNRFKKGYVPGKSDKDFIPRGPRASEAAKDFKQTFERKFGIKPSSLDVHALDPTDISSWKSRIDAAANLEKYNTRGGTKWLDHRLYKEQPDLWKFDLKSKDMVEVRYRSVVKTPPPPLTGADAAGFFSDNLKFHHAIALKYADDPRMAALMQAKYNCRNAEAFKLAGGKLKTAEQQLLKTAEFIRETGKVDAAMVNYMNTMGIANYDEAVRAYQQSMEAVTGRMAKKIAGHHVAILKSSKMSPMAVSELAASLANLPPQYAETMQNAVIKGIGQKEWQSIKELAGRYQKNIAIARFSTEYFDQQAMKRFGAAYDELKPGQRALLHGATEGGESLLGKAWRHSGTGLGLLCAGWAVYDAYHEGSTKGKLKGYLYGSGRAVIELVQWGYPPLAATELAMRLTALYVGSKTDAYKNDVLNTLYNRYRGGEKLDFVLNTQATVGYFAGGLREMVKGIRKECRETEHREITDAEIAERIRTYFTQRLAQEKMRSAFLQRIALVERWMYAREINLTGGSFITAKRDNEKLKAEDPKDYNRRLGAVMMNYARIESMLRKDGVPHNKAMLFHYLRLLYRGKPGDLQKELAKLYKGYGLSPDGKVLDEEAAAMARRCNAALDYLRRMPLELMYHPNPVLLAKDYKEKTLPVSLAVLYPRGGKPTITQLRKALQDNIKKLTGQPATVSVAFFFKARGKRGKYPNVWHTDVPATLGSYPRTGGMTVKVSGKGLVGPYASIAADFTRECSTSILVTDEPPIPNGLYRGTLVAESEVRRVDKVAPSVKIAAQGTAEMTIQNGNVKGKMNLDSSQSYNLGDKVIKIQLTMESTFTGTLNYGSGILNAKFTTKQRVKSYTGAGTGFDPSAFGNLPALVVIYRYRVKIQPNGDLHVHDAGKKLPAYAKTKVVWVMSRVGDAPAK